MTSLSIYLILFGGIMKLGFSLSLILSLRDWYRMPETPYKRAAIYAACHFSCVSLHITLRMFCLAYAFTNLSAALLFVDEAGMIPMGFLALEAFFIVRSIKIRN